MVPSATASSTLSPRNHPSSLGRRLQPGPRILRALGLGVVSLGLSLAWSAIPAPAQNVSGNPLYGTANLQAGFTPDPYTVNVTAGGGTDARTLNLGSGCVGFIATRQPDFRVNYQAGSFPLIFRARSSADTTLLINGPDGLWYCNDDFEGFNPQVAFPRPASGQYDIWVGTFGPNSAAATLSVTELTQSGSAPPAQNNTPNVSANPRYGTANLRAGFTPDPYSVNVTAGGNTDARTLGLGSSCVGYIATSQPDFRLNYQSGNFPLSFRVRSNADTTLVINGPDGRWYCNDDTDGVNPRVNFSRPQSGQYDVWVGTFGSNSAPAVLSVTEL